MRAVPERGQPIPESGARQSALTAPQYHQFATFREAKNGRLYLYTVFGSHGTGGVQAWERLGDANCALRAVLRIEGDVRKGVGTTVLWVDANGDGKEQPDERQTREGALYCQSNNGWSLNLGPDLALYAQDLADKGLKCLSADGFYLTRLFNGNIFEWRWWAEATPGSDMSDVPPGCGGEDFGGSVSQAKDPSTGSGQGGRVYVQSGKCAIWNLELTGLDKTKAIRGDVGVTHGDPSGTRTKLRTHWANQKTGLVDDVVIELQLAPQNWGDILFE